MESILLTSCIVTVTFIGWNILYAVSFKGKSLPFFERLSAAYGLGFGFVSLQMLVFYLLNIKFDTVRILAPWTVLLITNLIIYFRNKRSAPVSAPAIKDTEKYSGLSVFLSIAIAFEILYALFRALIKPLESYDAVAIYAIKSKIFYLAGSIPRDFFHNLGLAYPHPDYPLNIPLSETFVYLFLGNLNDQLVKVIFPLYFIGILATIYFGTRRFAGKTYALVFTFILASVPQFNAFAANGYLDIPLAYYCFTSALFLFLWFKCIKDTRLFLISAVFAGLGGWTKNEGLLYCAINISLLSLFIVLEHRDRVWRGIGYLFAYTGIISAINMPWLWIKITANLTNSDVGSPIVNPAYLFRQFYKIGPILYEFQKHVLGPKKWNFVWLIVVLVFIFNHKKIFRGQHKYVTIYLLLTVCGYTFFYLISSVEINYFLATTWSRFLIHFLPVAVFWLADMLKEDIAL